MSLYHNCPICKSVSIHGFLFRKQVPVHQNLVVRDPLSARNVPLGDLDLAVCDGCGFVFNRAFDVARLQYGEEYDNTQTYSPSFNAYLDDLVRHMVTQRSVRNCQVIEVGCGQGQFLRKLVEYEGAGNRGYGFDPSYQGQLVDLGGRLKFERRYYTEECADVPADVVISRHVIEHVPEPLQLLQNIRKALVHSENARVFCETPCVKWILRRQVIWDFFYEHCSYFSSESLATAFEIAGFQVQSVQHVFEGQYLWLEATKPTSGDSSASRGSATIVTLAAKFAQAEQSLTERWRRRIRDMAAQEKIALWGAGAKGVTFANLIEPRQKWLDCIVDLNPQKQGCYVPGTGHPIVAPEELAARGVTTAILMNPNYRDENLALLRQANLNVRLVDQI